MLCRASGDPHQTTFDNLRLDYMGICNHTLVSTECPGHIQALPQGLPSFTINAKNQHRYGKTHVSYLKYLIVKVGNDVVKMDQGGVVSVGIIFLIA